MLRCARNDRSFEPKSETYRGVEIDLGVRHQVQNRNDLEENVEWVAAKQVIQPERHSNAEHIVMMMVPPPRVVMVNEIIMVIISESKSGADPIIERKRSLRHLDQVEFVHQVISVQVQVFPMHRPGDSAVDGGFAGKPVLACDSSGLPDNDAQAEAGSLGERSGDDHQDRQNWNKVF